MIRKYKISMLSLLVMGKGSNIFENILFDFVYLVFYGAYPIFHPIFLSRVATMVYFRLN